MMSLFPHLWSKAVRDVVTGYRPVVHGQSLAYNDGQIGNVGQ